MKKTSPDNAKNSVVADRELRNSIDDCNITQIHEAMLQNNIDWRSIHQQISFCRCLGENQRDHKEKDENHYLRANPL